MAKDMHSLNMPTEHPFLTLPDLHGQTTQATATDALFDLAVNRAVLLLRMGPAEKVLPAWHARTRFARRVNLQDILHALAQKPTSGAWHWTGGKNGRWQAGKAAFP